MSRLKRLNSEVKKYDKDLYVIKGSQSDQIYRRVVRWDSFEYEGKTLHYAAIQPQFILALTHDWTLNGRPVEWGLEPLSEKLRDMDSHRDDSYFKKMVKDRKRQEDIDAQSKRNELKAAAADMRKDFAKATNDINTSSLAKIDRRRIKGA